jgi:hypothetical protein
MKQRIEIETQLDRQALEALLLEIRQLAKRYGADVRNVRIQPATDDVGTARAAETEPPG